VSARITDLQRLPDFGDTVGKLMNGRWLVYPYEAYRQFDRSEWNAELVEYLAERGVRAEVIDIRKKSVVVVINVDDQPTFEQVTESVAVIEHRRTRR
jgi:hypothetical protein